MQVHVHVSKSECVVLDLQSMYLITMNNSHGKYVYVHVYRDLTYAHVRNHVPTLLLCSRVKNFFITVRDTMYMYMYKSSVETDLGRGQFCSENRQSVPDASSCSGQ